MRMLLRVMPIVAVSMLTACGSQPSGTTQSAEQPANQPTTAQSAETQAKTAQAPAEQKVASEYVSPLPDDAPVYTVAMTGATPPFSYQDDFGVMTGIDVDVIRAIGEEEGFKVDFYKAYSWSDMFEAAATDKTELAMSGISYRDERAEKYSLSDPYFFNPAAVAYSNPELNVKSLTELKGQRIGAIKDSTSVEFANNINNPSKIDTIDTPYLAYESLLRGDIDATIYDLPVWRHYAKQIPEHKIIIQAIEDESKKGSHAVIMASKNNAELIEKVNSGLKKLQETGKVEEIKSKWLGN